MTFSAIVKLFLFEVILQKTALCRLPLFFEVPFSHFCHLAVTYHMFNKRMLNRETDFMKGKILLVEDEAPIREMLGYTLMKEGYTFREAADVEQGPPVARR